MFIASRPAEIIPRLRAIRVEFNSLLLLDILYLLLLLLLIIIIIILIIIIISPFQMEAKRRIQRTRESGATKGHTYACEMSGERRAHAISLW